MNVHPWQAWLPAWFPEEQASIDTHRPLQVPRLIPLWHVGGSRQETDAFEDLLPPLLSQMSQKSLHTCKFQKAVRMETICLDFLCVQFLEPWT